MGRGGRSVAGRMGKGRERRREAGRRPVVARPGARALGSARCVPRGTPTPAPSLRTSCTLHCATRILYSSLDTVHLELYSALILAPLYSAPHPALIITYPALYMEHRAPCTAQRLCLCILRLWPRPLQPSRPRPKTNSGGLVQSQTPHTHSLLCRTPVSVLVESAGAKLRVLRGVFIHSVKVKWAPILPGVEHAECTW